MSQRTEDIRVLRELFETGEEIPDAFEDMLIWLEAKEARVLNPKQRKWVNAIAKRFDVDMSDGPEEDNEPELTRLTAGEIPRGKEVEIQGGPKVMKPPGRR